MENKTEKTEIINSHSTITHNRFFKNVAIVLISNIISMVSGILIGFIIPKIMGVSEYGYYKTFTLYSSYIGLLHFGFIDGIYLKFAGKKFEDLDKEKFRTYTRFLFLMEGIITVLVVGISFFFFGSTYFLIIFFVGLNIFATNIISYFEFISQITMRFKITTARNIIRCCLNIISVLGLYLLSIFKDLVVYNYIYVSIVLSITYLLALWYVFTYRNILFGKGRKFGEEKKEIFCFFKVGVILLMSNLVSQLVFVVDQQFVNIAFDNDTYSLYAFAYNMISLITIATSAISAVLYPTLKTIDKESIAKNYSRINSYLLIFAAACLAAYYPLLLIVNYFLSQYVDSLQTFLIILPGVLISSNISVVKYNCYKAFGKITNYFVKSVIVLALAIVADLIAYYLFKNTASISMVSISILLIWYMLVELYFVRNFKVRWIRNFFYIILIIAGFYGISFIPNAFVAFGVYLAFFVTSTIIVYYSTIRDLLRKFKDRKLDKSANNTDLFNVSK